MMKNIDFFFDNHFSSIEKKRIYLIQSILMKLNLKKNNQNNGYMKKMFSIVRNVIQHLDGLYEK
jgi:hypothetical protein